MLNIFVSFRIVLYRMPQRSMLATVDKAVLYNNMSSIHRNLFFNGVDFIIYCTF